MAVQTHSPVGRPWGVWRGDLLEGTWVGVVRQILSFRHFCPPPFKIMVKYTQRKVYHFNCVEVGSSAASTRCAISSTFHLPRTKLCPHESLTPFPLLSPWSHPPGLRLCDQPRPAWLQVGSGGLAALPRAPGPEGPPRSLSRLIQMNTTSRQSCPGAILLTFM